jgi:glycogen debranching enzyme
MLTYDLSVVPFSLAGSFLLISARNLSGTHRLLLQTCSEHSRAGELFELALVRNGEEVAYTYTAQPHRLDLEAEGGGAVTLAFADADTLRFTLHDVDLRFLPARPFASEIWPDPAHLFLLDHPARALLHIRGDAETTLSAATDATLVEEAVHHRATMPAATLHGTGGAFRLSRFEEMWEAPLPPMEEVLAAREQEVAAWMAHRPEVPPAYEEAAQHAWFILWNCMTAAAGTLTRPAIYMSKFWMNGIWAWDNCFNALAVAEADPALAWNQMLLFFDHQDPQGMIPDKITDLSADFIFNKPPIYGWTIRKLVDKLGVELSRPYLEEIYEPVVRLTDWWYTLRDYDGDGMPQYHHGNDSGWDNATVFDQGYPTEGADLAAHLVLQTEALAWMAEVLGRKNEATTWRARSERQLEDLLTQQTKEHHFFSPLNGEEDAPLTRSLLNYIPMVLGHRLPDELRQALVQDLSPGGPFLTEHGLATESPQSPKYQPDGYWRGPIWAPSTYLIFDGLVDAGETAPARTVAERFCTMCARDNGFWENYNALTGEGLRCPGYSWTAAAFMLMATWLAENG